NWEIVTVIEYISVAGKVIPPMYIYKGGKYILGAHAGVQAKEQAIFAWSSKGLTNNESGLNSSTKQQLCILVLDGHGSHLRYPCFDFCLKRNIHPICLSEHSIHILLPLDVGFFGNLTACYITKLDLWIR
ncbi:hypothetical protein K440DRAFT_472827, partial [Wilcoxina mikolae CBS 423.85]